MIIMLHHISFRVSNLPVYVKPIWYIAFPIVGFFFFMSGYGLTCGLMKKKDYKNVELSCSFQQQDELPVNECLQGIISRTKKGFCFEEAVRHTRQHRNLKLYEGKYCSLVHRQNGKYQLHFKAFEVKNSCSSFEMARPLYWEMIEALGIIEQQMKEAEV